jgi:hypothetical protein
VLACVARIARRLSDVRQQTDFLVEDPKSVWWRAGVLLDHLAEAQAVLVELRQLYRSEKGGLTDGQARRELAGGRNGAGDPDDADDDGDDADDDDDAD